MKKGTPSESNYSPAGVPFRKLVWAELQRVAVVMSPGNAVHAIVYADGQEQLVLILFREGARCLFDVFVERPNVPDKVLVAMGRTIIAHLASEPKRKEDL